ncbi:MAG: hypothetical protein JW940_23920 [Polyangiaceae bacterium]|nr:hypothetical protein [Polyangiaceae bacterium]
MDVSTLIDAIVRQTTVLVAQLATAGGGRPQLAHTANQVFLDLVDSLKEQGLNSKVIADMFGLALRAYHAKIERLSESRTMRGRSLWEALLEYIASKGPVQRADVLARFSYDDPISVRGVLKDLVDSGVVYRTGRGDDVHYRAAEEREIATGRRGDEEAVANLVAMTVHRLAPASREELASALSLDRERLDRALTKLLADGRIRREGSDERFVSDGCILPLGDPLGWEAAVFDHYQAMVSALCNKLRMGTRRASAGDLVGGSTFSYRVWRGHPYYEEAVGLLAEFRARGSRLRDTIAQYNGTHSAAEEDTVRVISYAGQNIIGLESTGEEAHD